MALGGHWATVGHWKADKTHSFPGQVNPQAGEEELEAAYSCLDSPKSLTNLLV